MKNVPEMISSVVSKDAVFGENVKIFMGCKILGKCTIGNNVCITASVLKDCVIGNDCVVNQCDIDSSVLEDGIHIGPFSRLRPDCVIKKGCKIGAFVEIKASTLKENVKAAHHAYIGNATIGKNTNIGCGVVFVNYDGKNKNTSTVGDNCFIGSNSNIIAPVELANCTYVCAGTTVSQNTNHLDFVIGRSRPTIKKNGFVGRTKHVVEGE